MSLFPVPPGRDAHFDLGVWHPSDLPADKQNRDGYAILQDRFEGQDGQETATEAHEVAAALLAFREEVVSLAKGLLDAMSDEEYGNRSWSILLRGHHLISLHADFAGQIVPAILKSASRHGLVCYDPQNDLVFRPGE